MIEYARYGLVWCSHPANAAPRYWLAGYSPDGVFLLRGKTAISKPRLPKADYEWLYRPTRGTLSGRKRILMQCMNTVSPIVQQQRVAASLLIDNHGV